MLQAGSQQTQRRVEGSEGAPTGLSDDPGFSCEGGRSISKHGTTLPWTVNLCGWWSQDQRGGTSPYSPPFSCLQSQKPVLPSCYLLSYQCCTQRCLRSTVPPHLYVSGPGRAPGPSDAFGYESLLPQDCLTEPPLPHICLVQRPYRSLAA